MYRLGCVRRPPQLAAAMMLFLAPHGGLAQSDNDGIPDEWKTKGVTFTWPDGHSKHIDLASRGVQRGRKTIIVWVDWMEGNGHTHRPVRSGDLRPSPTSSPSPSPLERKPLDRIRTAFLQSGVDNGAGVTLAIIWADEMTWDDKPFQPIPEQTDLGDSSVGPDNQLHYDWTAFDQIRAERTGNLSSFFGKGFHYAAFIHRMRGLSNTGLSNGIPGDEFLVSLGVLTDGVGSADDQSGTFMHELGHNLGLNHGGFEDRGYKPNYISVMNYMFQRVGVANLGIYGHFDYSHTALADLDESKLSVRDGISSSANLASYGTAHVCTSTPPQPLPTCTDSAAPLSYTVNSYGLIVGLNCPVDWQCAQADPTINPCPLPATLPAATISADVNGDGCVGVLKGYDDWSNLHYWSPPQLSAGVTARRELLPRQELDGNTPTLLTAMTVDRVNATPSARGVLVSWSRIPLQRVVGYELLRQSPSGRVSIVRRTKSNRFLDTSASAGVPYVYSVRPVIAASSAEEAKVLVGEVKDGVATAATLLKMRSAKLNLLPEGSELVRGLSKRAPAVTIQ